MLISGYSPLPKSLFEDENLYREVSNYFGSIKPNQPAVLSQYAKTLVADFSLSLEEAKKGLFSYDEEDYGPIHRLDAIPIMPLRITALPEHIQDFLAKFYIPEINFKDTDTIDTLKYFDCVPWPQKRPFSRHLK